MEIVYGSGGIFGALVIGGLVVVAALAAVILFTAFKGAHDQVVEDAEDDPDRAV